ncbi:WhiB family transcriptional regulator [Streptomyces sp. UNOC14_S4]|uniref:WhiB family transcriptional regulator n=1 Tax=Streptomyces sp. UNOC14_S4 TaxID=2872340 RepID=UPI001E60A9D2|nr:WhiB family transcriptional regulator [Streptomyces sp. UNOC14_S4]MCC3767684.1 WhiB family transcriptional regulator [Streptomyces sp. UNOC14_S4]
MSRLVKTALNGDWAPLLEAAANMPGKHWAEDARCADKKIGAFFPHTDVPWADPDQVRRSQGIALNRPLNLCAACPLATAARCLVESLRHGDEYGIRGGLLASERQNLLRSWNNRIDAESVAAVLRGVPTVLGTREREEVISRFAADPTMDANRVARGLGIPTKYLRQLTREYQQRRRPAASSSAPSSPLLSAA